MFVGHTQRVEYTGYSSEKPQIIVENNIYAQH